MKTPKSLSKLLAALSPQTKKRLHATARAARPAIDEYDDEEPTTKLSSAFIVVLILHVVAVGGIYAFNSIKASRKGREDARTPAAPVAVAPAVKPASQNMKPAATPVAPTTNTTARISEPAAPATVTPSKVVAGKQYEVKPGDNLTKIAFAYGVSAADLAAANHLKDNALLKPGQVLAIPAAKAPAKPTTPETRKSGDVPPTKTTPGLYTVKKGDTLTSIARAFGLSAEDLIKANKNTDPKKLQLGQVLKVPPRKS